MKNLVSLFSLVVIVALLAACGPAAPEPAPAGDEAAEESGQDTGAAEPAAEEEEVAEEEPVAEEAAEEEAAAESEGEAVAADRPPLVVLQGVDANTLDPHKSSSITERVIVDSIFDTLLIQDRDGTLQPGIATEWSSIDDNTWEFKIRPDVVAHNGEVVDANDVAYSFNRVADPETEATGHLLWILGNIKFENAEAIDEETVHVITDGPSPTVPEFMWAWTILPQDYYESLSLDEAASEAVGTGPFSLNEWRRGDRVVLDANPDYWAGAPEVSQVIWRTVPEASARIAELNTGGADIVTNIPPDLVEEVDSEFASVETVEGLRRMYVGMSFYLDEAIQDKRVRQALNYGINIQRSIDGLLAGNGERTGTFANPPNQAPTVDPYPHDPEQALALMNEAGYEDLDGDGFVDRPDGSRLELTLLAPRDRYIKDFEMAQTIAADLQDAGIFVEVEPIEWSNYMSQAGAKELTGELWFLGAGAGYGCQADLSDWSTQTAWGPGGWENEEFDALFLELSSTFDPDTRQELCYELQEILYEEAPLLFLYNQVDYYGVSNRIDWEPRANERIYIYRDVEFVE